mgnify:CR=1 FL=1
MYSVELDNNQVMSVDAEQALAFINAGMTVYKTTVVPVTKDELEQVIANKKASALEVMAQPENVQSVLITPAD